MKDLRRMWWVMWVVALGMAVGILLLQQGGKAYVSFIPYGWALWIVAMGGAFYLEFFPIRKERAAMVAAAQAARSGKSGKAEKQAAPAKSEKTKKRTQGATAIPAPDDRQPPPPEDPA
jgi:hypothetical protein